MKFKQEENKLEKSLNNFKEKNIFLKLWIDLKINLRLYWIYLINKKK